VFLGDFISRRIILDGIYEGRELEALSREVFPNLDRPATALDIGQNALAMLITRSLAEMGRFAVSLGANPFTFLGLAGVGDLFATCTSPLSRNFQLGKRIASGASVGEAMDSLGKLAEGVNTVRVVHEKAAELGVYMPLADGLYRLLFEGAELGAVVRELMTSEQRLDVEFAAPTAWSHQR
jgi:glycerol-3-phosphate dehydrogenase (NAD(P)+)